MTESVKSRNTNKMSEAVEIQAPAAGAVNAVKGMKKNGMYIRSIYERNRKLTAKRTGKQWHDNKTAFRPRANQTSWDKRTLERKALAAVKAKEKEMKEEKEADRQVRI
jgi:rRNA-processing protein CGR1